MPLLDHWHRRSTTALAPSPAHSLRRIFGDAVIVNVLNPKMGLFFLAFVPQFVQPERGHTTLQLLVFGGVYIAWGVISDGVYALGAAWFGDRLRRRAFVARSAGLLTGTTYIGLGLATAASGSNPRS